MEQPKTMQSRPNLNLFYLMKKILLSLAVVCCSLMANAQFTVGGNLGFDVRNASVNYSESVDRSQMPSQSFISSLFQIGPKLGWTFKNGTMSAGLIFDFAWANENYSDGVFSFNRDKFNYLRCDGAKLSVFSWSVTPYFRWNFVSITDRLSIFAEANVSFGGNSYKAKYFDQITDKWDQINDIPSNFYVSASIVPGLNYKFNSHFSLDVYVDLLRLYESLSFSSQTVKNDVLGTSYTTTEVSNHFGFGATTIGKSYSIDEGALMPTIAHIGLNIVL